MAASKCRLTLNEIDSMTATEIGLLLGMMGGTQPSDGYFTSVQIHKILNKASSILMVGGSAHRYDLNLTPPHYSQLELDLMEDWREVSPEELFGDLDEHELHKMGYAIAVDHKANVN